MLLAGDAGHVHSPAGGQGMNLGIVDAVDLGDTLADVLAGAPDTLLDAYAARRRPMAEEVVAFAARLTRLATLPPAARPARNLLFRLLGAVPPARTGSRCASPACTTATGRAARPPGGSGATGARLGCPGGSGLA